MVTRIHGREASRRPTVTAGVTLDLAAVVEHQDEVRPVQNPGCRENTASAGQGDPVTTRAPSFTLRVELSLSCGDE